MIYETHAHFDDDAYANDIDVVLQEAKDNGIGRIVNVGASMRSSKTTYELTEKYPYIYGAVGVHPECTKELTESDMDILKDYTASEKIVAIGEIGLDYYWDEPERDIQKKWFIRQLELAKQVSLPVIIHSRDAAADTLDIMKSAKAQDIGGVIHCFSYGIEMAREYLNMGFYIGVGGVVTFKNGKKLKEVVEYVPLDRIVTETDSPYLTPVPFRGKRNSSAYIPYIIEEIARIKGLSIDEVEEATWNNALALYRQNH